LGPEQRWATQIYVLAEILKKRSKIRGEKIETGCVLMPKC